MKKIIFFFILTLPGIFPLVAQDYQTIRSDRIAYFFNQVGYVSCIRIDSVTIQTDSVFYPFSNIRELDDGCYTPFGSSWIGEKIILKENGLNIFFNKDHDSIQLKTNALLNDSWTLFNLPDSIKIIATIIKQDTMSFMGLLDSVKSIGFQVYDKNMNLLDYVLNNMELKISKNYGFVSTFNFYFFPDLQISYPFEQFEEYDLIGLSNPKIGVQNLTWFEVNDFQPGDEIHVLDETRSVGGGYDHAETINTIYKYLERFDYTDSVKYVVEIKQNIYKSWPPWTDNGTFEYKQDTIHSTIKANSQFDKLPGEPVVSDHGAYNYNMSTYYYQMPHCAVITKSDPSSHLSIFASADSCWYLPVNDECITDDYYLKGLGGPYYDCDYIFVLGGTARKLVYYKKGQVTWGVPLIITGIQDKRIERKINIFPNPAKDFITIQMEEYNQPVIFEMFDLKGGIILTKAINSRESKIGIADLKPGIYMYRLRDNSKVLKIDKLIIN